MKQQITCKFKIKCNVLLPDPLKIYALGIWTWRAHSFWGYINSFKATVIYKLLVIHFKILQFKLSGLSDKTGNLGKKMGYSLSRCQRSCWKIYWNFTLNIRQQSHGVSPELGWNLLNLHVYKVNHCLRIRNTGANRWFSWFNFQVFDTYSLLWKD